MQLDSQAKGLTEPRFGIDAPWWVAGLAVINPIVSGHMLWSSLRGKLRRVGGILDSINLPPGSSCLDVGCGHGLMTIQALRRHAGRVTALDHWSSFDQAGNSRDALERNLIAEFVHHKVTIVDADARQMPLPSASFDVVMSSFVLHNLPLAAERRKILAEMMRVLKPGGTIVVLDINYTAEYAAVFRESDAFDVTLSGIMPLFLPMITRACIATLKDDKTGVAA